MTYSRRELNQRALEYAKRNGSTLLEFGSGTQGIVYNRGDVSAVKVHARKLHYLTERDVYRRLMEQDMRRVLEFAIPELLDYDDDLLIIEMTIVQPPFILDFASAYLDRPAPEFTDEVWAEWEAEKKEQFGTNWPRVQAACSRLRTIGVYLADIHPGNVKFP